jgi:hypothetical protein
MPLALASRLAKAAYMTLLTVDDVFLDKELSLC